MVAGGNGHASDSRAPALTLIRVVERLMTPAPPADTHESRRRMSLYV
jgi:hypothetical protein